MFASKIKSFSELVILVISWGVFATAYQAYGQSGGQFVIDHSVIAGGGTTNSSGGTFALGGTIGQSIAGQQASGGPFTDHAGFWIPDDLAVTAEHVTLSGRVIQASGAGIQNIRVTMMLPDGTLRIALTNTFGYFRFDEVEVGQTYFFTATSKKHTFQQSMLVKSILAAADDLIFIALN